MINVTKTHCMSNVTNQTKVRTLEHSTQGLKSYVSQLLTHCEIKLISQPIDNNIDQKQVTECGSYVINKYLPRFMPVGTAKLIQTINVGSHWVCISNVLGSSTCDVYIYHSLDDLDKQIIDISTIV